jgi:sulfoxide reductase heme-binding subunit YedZ
VLLASPFAYLGWLVFGEIVVPGSRLGPDAGEAVVAYLGDWSLRLLLVVLAVTTLSRRVKQPRLISIRRQAGLFAFAAVVLHFFAYLSFLAVFDWQLIREDLIDRRYITVGFLALLLLLPLAVTSTRGWQRRLGRRWKRLHKLVYVIVPLGLLHLAWLTKDEYSEVVALSIIYLLLMMERALARRRQVIAGSA